MRKSISFAQMNDFFKPMECNDQKVPEKKCNFCLKSYRNPGSSKNQNHCRESIT